MRKDLFVIGILVQAIFVLAVTIEALACGWDYYDVGYCPKGSCSVNGGGWACNVKYCSPRNCQRH